MLNAAPPRLKDRIKPTIPCTWRSSWTATAAGRRPAACRARRAIVAASRRCDAWFAPPPNSAFSSDDLLLQSENWSRPATEIGDLFGLLRRFIRNDLATLHRDGVRVRVIGERDGLEPDICALLNEAEELTKDNTRLNLVVAFNYGSRQEIANAAQRLAREVAEGKRDPASIDADTLGRYLDAPDIPDPDLIIRTSGEQRLSNFLMWQAAYSELVFVPIHWPDFDKAALEGAIAEYARRERRFGGLAAKTGS